MHQLVINEGSVLLMHGVTMKIATVCDFSRGTEQYTLKWRYRSQDRQWVKLLCLEQAASVENTEMYKELFTELLKDF